MKREKMTGGEDALPFAVASQLPLADSQRDQMQDKRASSYNSPDNSPEATNSPPSQLPHSVAFNE